MKTFWLGCMILVMGCASKPKVEETSVAAAVAVPFAIDVRMDVMTPFPDSFWDANYQFSSIRSAETDGAIQQSSADGRVTLHRLDKTHVTMKFFLDSCERSEKMPGSPEQFQVTHKQSKDVFGDHPFSLTLDLATKQVSDAKGFERVEKLISKKFKGKPEEDFFNGVLSSIKEDPSSYLNFGPFALSDLQTHKPREHWIANQLDQSFAGWTTKSNEPYAVFTSATQAEPLKLETKTDIGEISGSFGVNSWLLIRADWKILHSKFQIHQSIMDMNTKHEITGTSTIENTLEAI